MLVFIIGFVGIQFIPTSLNQSDIIPKEDIIQYYNPPEGISAMLKNSCYDCHSNNTAYPWYNKIQPISWLLQGHIDKAKEELNFSNFKTYSKRKQKSKLKSIISQIEDNEMPLKGYVLMHENAKLSDKDKTVLTSWVEKIKDSL